MRKTLIFAVLAIMVACPVPAGAQMSDQAIVQYITTGVAAGKSQTQLANELIAKGVSTSQMKRVYNKYKSQGASLGADAKETSAFDEKRPVRKSPVESEDSAVAKLRRGSEGNAEGYDDRDTVGTRAAVKEEIYGHSIFTNRKLTFEPSENAATPENYVLGPGDEVIIDVWGVNEATIKQTISPEGRIMVSQVGPIQLSGLTIAEARARIKTAFSRKYAALGGSASQISLTLGQNRTIMVNVMGEVAVPGTYRLSSFSTVFNALYKAGGVTPVGSMREVALSRAGEKIATVDIYEYLFEGSAASDLPLRDGDVIIVPAYRSLVTMTGKVKRPMLYELAEGQTLSQALSYAGGFAGDAYKDDIRVIRQTGGEQQVFTVRSDKFDSFAMCDGDLVEVSAALEKFSNKLEVKGAVKRPGIYEWGEGIKTVSQLIARAGGLEDDAFLGRAQIIREKDDLSLEVLSISLVGVVDGSSEDILLKKNDVLYVSSSNELEEKGDFTISGYVANPGEYPYADHTSVEDLILLAGGLVDGASSVRVDVSRRINDPSSTEVGEKLAEVFTFGIKDGLLVDGKPDFELKPFDVVAVRRSPGYTEQKVVNVIGEVAFPGQYTLMSSDERVSDLIARAGGATQHANLHGAMLKRKITDVERDVRRAMVRVAKQNGMDTKDTTSVSKLSISEMYNVGLELDKAVAKPGSDFDIVLRDGDELVIPEMPSTVRIQGDVFYPNTVAFISGKPIRYYVRQAGGYTTSARRAKSYVVYMNGNVDSGLHSKVEPGCEIVVPTRPEREKVTAGEWMSIASSTSSVAAMIVTIVSLLK